MDMAKKFRAEHQLPACLDGPGCNLRQGRGGFVSGEKN